MSNPGPSESFQRFLYLLGAVVVLVALLLGLTVPLLVAHLDDQRRLENVRVACLARGGSLGAAKYGEPTCTVPAP